MSAGVLEPAALRVETQLGESISDRIAIHGAASPRRLAIVDGAHSFTFGELNDRSNVLAARLRDMGAGSEVCIGLLFDRSADFIIAALAVLKAGAAYLPLDSSTPPDRAAFILADAGAPILLTHREKGRELQNGSWRVIDLNDCGAGFSLPTENSQSRLKPAPQTLAYVIYTSGSTGRPKGVEITHGNLLNLIDWHVEAFGVTEADRASQVAGLGFDAAGWEIWPALTAGASIHIADEMTRRSPQALRDWLVAEKVTISFVPTVLAEQLVHSAWPAETAMRTMLTGADTLHRCPVAGLPFQLVNNYGPTECTVVATSGLISPEASDGPPPIGWPILNTTVVIVDDALNPVADGEAGELCLAGKGVGRGYRNLPDETARCFINYSSTSGELLRVYRTGDRAKLLPDGQLAFLGRMDDQVKIRGYRIELGEITACLDRCPGIEGSAVVARDASDGPELAAYIVSSRDAKLTSRDLREFMASRLPDYMIPAKLVSIASLPITPNGKLDKSALPAPGTGNLLPSGIADLPRPAASDGVEPRIAQMVATLLGQTAVAREDNFFMLGGHSMLGVQLVARIRDSFGVKLTLRQLFGAPTVAALSNEVAKMTSGA